MALIASIGLSSGATILNIDDVYTGVTPAADAPWVTVTATTEASRANGDAADVVNLNIKASSEWNDPSEFISKLAFTLNDGIEVGTNTVFQVGNPIFLNGTTWEGPDSLDVRPGAVNVGGGYTLDGAVDFFTSSASDGILRFDNGKSFDLVVTYTGSGSLTDENFFGDNPIAVAHIQGVGFHGGGSGWARSVPEPSTALLGLLGLAGLARRKR